MAHHLHALAGVVAEGPRRAVTAAAEELERVAEAEARRATGDGRMSGMGRRGPRLRAVTKVRAGPGTATATVAGVPAGPWAILEGGAAPHVIAARGRVLSGPGMRHPVRGPVRHPGARAKRTWSRVVDEAGELLAEAAGDGLGEALR